MQQNRLTGEEVINKLYDDAGKARISNISSFSPELGRLLKNSIGMTYGCDIIPFKIRSAITIAIHIILGDTVGIKIHYGNGLNAGFSIDELKQIVLCCALHTGSMTVEQALLSLKELIAEQNK
jgi:alkylhydroperoxidase/carboxymuconolactone decarboxylase family protein YurZ